MRCERVPVRWKRVFMLVTYLYVRGGELQALDWGDVSSIAATCTCTRALDAKGVLKATKGEERSQGAIEPHLLPLLRRLHDGVRAEGEGHHHAASGRVGRSPAQVPAGGPA